MHPRTAEILDHLERHRVAFRETVERVPPELRERRPAADRWSPAEVVDHLATLEGRLTAMLTKQIAAARAAGVGRDPDESPVLPGTRMHLALDRRRKIESPEAVRPREGIAAAAALAALEQARERLVALVREADGLDLSTVSYPHPVFGPLDGYQWLAFIGTHEARHAAQIEECVAEMGAGDW